MTLPLRRAFRDGHDPGRDERADGREEQLRVAHYADRSAGQLAEGLGAGRGGGREQDRAAERARPPKYGANACRNADRDKAEDDERGRHSGGAPRRREDRERAEPPRPLHDEVPERQQRDGREGEERQKEEVGEKAPPREEQREDREDSSDLRTGATGTPRRHDARDERDPLHDRVRERRRKRYAPARREENDARAPREHRLDQGRKDTLEPGPSVVQQEGGVRDRKDAGGDGAVPERGAPAALGGDRDQVVGREEPCDLLRRDRQAEGDRRPRTVTPDPRDHERERVEQVGAPADGERGEAGRAEETGEEEGTESGGRAPQDERHRREKTGDIEIVRVDPRRHEGDEQQERQRGVARPPDEFIVRAVAARTQRPGS